MSTDLVAGLVADLGTRIGFRDLRLDASGACQLLFDKRWLVTVLDSAASGSIALLCPLTTPHGARELGLPALLDMLRAGFLGRGAGGASLCLGPDERVYLQRMVPVAEGAERVREALEHLVDDAETWSERLLRAEPEVSLHPAPATEALAPQWARV